VVRRSTCVVHGASFDVLVRRTTRRTTHDATHDARRTGTPHVEPRTTNG
jgi:hypothetical protein